MANSISPQEGSPVIFPHEAVGPPPEPVKPTQARVDYIDLLRGIVMVIMMLDHTRDFIHYGALRFDPTDLNQTNPAVFMTRWITHFCAPVFVFLAGSGIYLQIARGKGRRELSHFLLTRGLWLIVLEFTLVRLGAFFSFDYEFLGAMQVIWVIGFSMIIMSVLIYWPVEVVGAFGLAMIFLHNLLDGIKVSGWRGPGSAAPSVGAKLWMILHQPFEVFPVAGFPSPVVFVLYPLIPWVGVMAAGYAFGSLYRLEAARRRRLLLIIGSTATALFIVLRALNRYGDPAEWSRQKNHVFTVLSFLNTTKYPPSLSFLLMTLGPAIIALGWLERVNASAEKQSSQAIQRASPRELIRYLLGRLRIALITFGRVPLFFYLLQWPTAHLISVILHLAFGKPVGWLFETPIGLQNAPDGIGFDLWVVYVCWIAGLVLLYSLCKWFARVKQQRRDWWLSYL